MRARVLIGSIASATAFLAAPAGATGIAGWDFSQYFGDGLLSTDGVSFTNTLPANYSNLDPTFNAGAESAAFGTMFMNGSFGSTNVDAGGGSEQLLPTSGSLASNIGFAPASNPFDSFSILTSEGQTFANALGMTALQAVSVVFSADLSSASLLGQSWSLALGAKTFSGTSTIGVEFSTDGSSYSSVGTFNLTGVDSLFTLALAAAPSAKAFVRLNIAGPASGQAILDNVSILATTTPVPEPGTAAMLLLGLAGLAVSGRRQRA